MFIGQNQFCSPDLLAKIADVIESPVIITRLGNSGHYDQRIIYINPAFSGLTGYAHDELLGRSIDIICDPRTGASKMLDFYSACRASQNFTVAIDSFKKQGSELKLRLDVRPIVDNVQGAYYYIIMCKEDISAAQQNLPENSGSNFVNNFNKQFQFAAQPQFNQPAPNNFAPAGFNNYQQHFTQNYPQQQQFKQQPFQEAHVATQFQQSFPQPQFNQPVKPQPEVNPQGYMTYAQAQAMADAKIAASEAAKFSAQQNPQPQPSEDFGIPVAPVVTAKKAEIKTDEKIADYCKTQFLSNMSHDLRTPLNAIIGFSEVIKDQLFGPIENNRYVSYANDIHSSGKELLGTINEIMELSEVEPKAEEINEEKIDLSDVIESVLDVLSPKAFENDVKIIKALDAEDVKFKGDRRKLKQVIAGVVGVGIKHSKKGSKIELSSSITDKGDFRFVVYAPSANLGGGKSSLGSLLGTVTKKVENDNPELAFARQFIEAHQGKFSIFHSAASGTEMNVTLPATRIAIEPEKKTWLKVIS